MRGARGRALRGARGSRLREKIYTGGKDTATPSAAGGAGAARDSLCGVCGGPSVAMESWVLWDRELLQYAEVLQGCE